MEFNHRVEQAISTPRLTTYRAHAFSDEQAWALYRWNIELSAAIAPIAADLEVTLRNTIHDRLSEHFGRADWWASTSLHLDDATNDMLTEVVKKHQKKIAKGAIGPGIRGALAAGSLGGGDRFLAVTENTARFLHADRQPQAELGILSSRSERRPARLPIRRLSHREGTHVEILEARVAHSGRSRTACRLR